MIGVTGTNGKTTVTHMIDYLLEELGKPTALIGRCIVKSVRNALKQEIQHQNINRA